MKEQSSNDHAAEMRKIGFQLKALAHLLSLTGGTGDSTIEQANWGLGQILDRLGKRTISVAHEVERAELLRMKEKEKWGALCQSKKS